MINLVFTIILIIAAIIHAASHKSESRQIIYTGLALLLLSGIYFLVLSIALYNFGPITPSWVENIAEISLKSLFLTIPAGFITLAIGAVLRLKRKK